MGEGMVRKQIYITQEQERRLKQIAKRRRCTEAELIRDSLQRALEDEEERKALWSREMTRMHQITADAKRLQQQGLTGEGRTWTRDEIYEDRYKRHAG
jgi:predicted DNA-binding protein